MSFGNNTNDFAPLNLKKGDILDLTKSVPSLKNVVLAGGWDANDAGNESFDLDISAFLLDKNDRVVNPNQHICYFGHPELKGVILEGDNLTGNGDGDDERIDINLDLIDPSIEKILFNVNIYEAINKRQTFGMVKNSYVRILDADNGDKEICRYELLENASTATAVIFAQLERTNNGWSFKTIGNAVNVRDLNQLLMMYL